MATQKKNIIELVGVFLYLVTPNNIHLATLNLILDAIVLYSYLMKLLVASPPVVIHRLPSYKLNLLSIVSNPPMRNYFHYVKA